MTIRERPDRDRFELIYWMPPGTSWHQLLTFMERHTGHHLETYWMDKINPGGPNHMVMECHDCEPPGAAVIQEMNRPW